MVAWLVSSLPVRGVVAGLSVLALLVALPACGGEAEPRPETPTTTAGTPSPTRSAVDLATAAADLAVFGADAGDYLADRFSLAQGDFNGDGKADLLVGAPLADGPDNSRVNAGEAYVILGSADIEGTLDLASGRQDVTIFGASDGDNLGFVVASGDINGDRIDDILVGARFVSPDGGRSYAGEAYVILGSSSLGQSMDVALGQQDFTVVGAEASDYLGYGLASGDINGDGVEDIIVLAPGADGPNNDRQNAGEAYVVLGSLDLTGTIDVGQNQQDFTILGAEAEDFLANFAASGDINGDDRDDILLGTHKADGPDNQRPDGGEAYVILGSQKPKGTLDLASGKGFLTVWGGDGSDWLGFFLAAADLNGDGVDDLIVSARNADGLDNSRNNCGEVYLIFGSPKLPESVDIALGQQDVTLIGSDLNDLFGHSLASGDINGDDIADVLVGAPAADSAHNYRPDGGEVLAFFGSPSWPTVVDSALGQQSVAIWGGEDGDELGFSLASGDVDGDGKADIIGGALLADGPGNARPDAGEAYVILSVP